MKKLTIHILGLLLAVCFADGSLSASPLFTTGTIGGETDTLSIILSPLSGAIVGQPGATVGWGFTVDWTATNNFISFTGSSLGSVLAGETNSSFLAGYTDFIGANSGPNGIALGPGTWTQSFNSVSTTGVGAYAISANPSLAIVGAQDTGQITFNFDIYSGDPSVGSPTDLGSFSFYGNSTAFSVTVTSAMPEPGTLWLLCAAAGMAALWRVKQTGKPRD
jgi:hypothetical protein